MEVDKGEKMGTFVIMETIKIKLKDLHVKKIMMVAMGIS